MKKTKKRSSKGILIKGMSKNLPSEILIDPTFKEELKKIMRGHSGIYALYKDDKLYYVGLTGDLLGRIRWHLLRDRHSGRWDHFKIFHIPRTKYLKDIETLIHNIAKIKGSRATGRLPEDADINQILREVVHEYEKKIKIIKKALR